MTRWLERMDALKTAVNAAQMLKDHYEYRHLMTPGKIEWAKVQLGVAQRMIEEIQIEMIPHGPLQAEALSSWLLERQGESFRAVLPAIERAFRGNL